MNNEPVAWMELYYGEPNNLSWTDAELRDSGEVYKTVPLYTHPVKQTYRELHEGFSTVIEAIHPVKELTLTDEEMLECAEGAGCVFDYSYKGEVTFISKNAFKRFIQAILRKAQEK